MRLLTGWQSLAGSRAKEWKKTDLHFLVFGLKMLLGLRHDAEEGEVFIPAFYTPTKPFLLSRLLQLDSPMHVRRLGTERKD